VRKLIDDRVRKWPGFVLVAIGFGCAGKAGSDPSVPGTAIGTFAVHATRVEDTCGDAPVAWDFSVKLTREAATLYWVQGGEPVASHKLSTGSYEFTSTAVHDLRPANKALELAACSVARDDQSSVTMAADDATFTGTLEYAYVPVAGADCRDQTVEFGGTFAALPCKQRFSLDAQKSSTK
jgi:hypothetical protein